jgi:ribosomal-protein-serine acetyltransferase
VVTNRRRYGSYGHGVLRELTIADVEPYYALVDRNRAHLNHFGNYELERDATFEDIRSYFESPWDANVRFGIWHDGALVGRVDLNPVSPPHWVLGYWLDEAHVGRGLATAAGREAIEHARTLGATELYAGVTHGNDRSIRVLERLGFEHVQDLPDRSRWRLALVDDPPPPVLA